MAANQELALDAKANGLSLHVERVRRHPGAAVQATSVAKAVKEFGGLDIIVNAAAFHPFGTVVETDLETWNRCLMVNVGSIYLLGHFGIPEMKKRGGGSIINLASVQGHACQRGVAAYAASKGAVHSLTRAHGARSRRRQHTGEFDQPGFDTTLPCSNARRETLRPACRSKRSSSAGARLIRWAALGRRKKWRNWLHFWCQIESSFCTGGDYLVDGGLLAGIGVQ